MEPGSSKQGMGMAANPVSKAESHKGQWWWWAVIPLAPVMYVLAMPVLMAVTTKFDGRHVPPNWVVELNMPLFWVANRSPTVESALNVYNDWWCRQLGVRSLVY